jgi:TnpA family transposase
VRSTTGSTSRNVGTAGNGLIYFGKGGDIPSNNRDEQELSVRWLRVLQAAAAYLNTRMIQDASTRAWPS